MKGKLDVNICLHFENTARANFRLWRAAKADNFSKKYYGMVYDLGFMIYKVFSVVIIRSG